MKDLSRKISLICSVCGNSLFETISDVYEDMELRGNEPMFKCSDCGRLVSKQDLLYENSELIDANIEDIRGEVIDEINIELKKMFKKYGVSIK